MEIHKQNKLEQTAEQIKSYLHKRAEYAKLYLLEKVSKILADLVTNFLVILFFLIFFLIGSIALAFYLSDVLGSYAGGFGLVTLLFVLIAVLVTFFKLKVERSLQNFAVRKYFNKISDNEKA